MRWLAENWWWAIPLSGALAYVLTVMRRRKDREPPQELTPLRMAAIVVAIIVLVIATLLEK